MRKLHGHLKAVKEAAVERKLPQAKPITLTPQEQSLDEDLNEAAQVRSSISAAAYCRVTVRLLVNPQVVQAVALRTLALSGCSANACGCVVRVVSVWHASRLVMG